MAVTKIKKVLITQFGDESKLAVVEGEIDDPKPGEVQVEVAYSVVSGSDVNMRRGVYPFQRKAPLTPGYSVLGNVVANGHGATRFKVGETVASLSKYDGQAERINLDERYVVRVPAGVDPKAAVVLVLDWVTAYEMLHRAAKLSAGQIMFVHGLSGAVGGALLELGKLASVTVLGTASARKLTDLRQAGATAFDYGNKDWMTAVRDRGGVNAVFDPLGYESFDESYSILRRGGVLVGYGMNLPVLTGAPRGSAFPVVLKLLARNLALWKGRRTTFFGLNRASRHFNEDLQTLFQILAQGRIEVPIKAVFSMGEIQQAHREYEHSAGRGSIVLAIRSRTDNASPPSVSH